MQNKNILITGVSRGVGLYLCKRFASEGNKIIGIDLISEIDINPDLKQLLYHYYSFNLSQIADIKFLVKRIIEENTEIHVLINNAGIKSFKLLDEYTEDDFVLINKINFLAPAILTKHFIPYMNTQKYGRIINMASNAGFEGYSNGAVYCSSKGAIHLFTQSVAYELSKGVTINAISPATIATTEFLSENQDLDPKKFVQPEQIYKRIKKIINSELNGKIFPLISVRLMVKYLIKDFQKYLNWFFRF